MRLQLYWATKRPIRATCIVWDVKRWGILKGAPKFQYDQKEGADDRRQEEAEQASDSKDTDSNHLNESSEKNEMEPTSLQPSTRQIWKKQFRLNYIALRTDITAN